jgi:hypothetical protein
MGAGFQDVEGLALAEPRCRLRLDQVVDARRAAADLGLSDLAQRKPWDRPQYFARRGADPLPVSEVAGVVIRRDQWKWVSDGRRTELVNELR